MPVFLCVSICHEYKYTQRLEEGIRSSGAGVTYGSFELPDIGAGNPVLLLCKRSMHSLQLNCLSSPNFVFNNVNVWSKVGSSVLERKHCCTG